MRIYIHSSPSHQRPSISDIQEFAGEGWPYHRRRYVAWLRWSYDSFLRVYSLVFLLPQNTKHVRTW